MFGIQSTFSPHALQARLYFRTPCNMKTNVTIGTCSNLTHMHNGIKGVYLRLSSAGVLHLPKKQLFTEDVTAAEVSAKPVPEG